MGHFAESQPQLYAEDNQPEGTHQCLQESSQSLVSGHLPLNPTDSLGLCPGGEGNEHTPAWNHHVLLTQWCFCSFPFCNQSQQVLVETGHC